MIAIGFSVPFLCQGLQFDVFVGYGGIVREVSWFPVTCEVMNDGPAFTGTIEISGSHIGSKRKRQMKIELPTNTRKRVVIPVFHSTGGLASWDGRLYDESGKLRAEQPSIRAKEVSWEGIIMGSLSRTFAGMPKFPELRQNESSMQPEIGRLTLDQFPTTSIALEGLSSLYLNSEQALKLNANHITALSGWVANGGHLILAIEQPADVIASEWLRPLNPFIPEGVSQVAVGSTFHDWLTDISPESVPIVSSATVRRSVVSDGRQRQLGMGGIAYSRVPRELDFETGELPVVTGQLVDGEVLMEADGIPLVVSASRGRGLVTALTFSPEREPFRSWKSKTWFWAKLNRVPSEWFDAPRFNTFGGASIDGVFGSLIESRQVRKLPVQWLLLLLVVYLIVIGPFDHWFLKRIDRQMLTWITFPAYVVVFSLLIYYIGYRLRSGESEWNEFHVVDVIEGQGGAMLRGRSYASIYSPQNRRYNVQCEVPGAVFRGEFLGAAGGGLGVGEASIMHADAGALAEIFVPVWTSQLYVADWATRAALPFRVEVVRTGAGFEVLLENLGTQTVESVGLVVGDRFFELDGVASGGKRTDSIDSSLGTPLREFVTSSSSSYDRALASRRQALGETIRLNDVSRHSQVVSFISESQSRGRNTRGFLSPPGMDLSALAQRGDAVVLLYYPDHSPITPMNGFRVSRNKRGTLMRMAVSPK